MTPQTTRAEDAFRKVDASAKEWDQPTEGTWVCHDCNTGDKGGQAEFYRHWLREHYVAPDERKEAVDSC